MVWVHLIVLCVYFCLCVCVVYVKLDMKKKQEYLCQDKPCALTIMFYFSGFLKIKIIFNNS